METERLRGVRAIAFARTIRWIGWGFGEPLIPIFIAAFAATFAEAGLLRSVYDIAGLVALPLIGMLAGRYPARTLILGAILLYPLIGISYFLAGVTGLAVFIVIARAVNGVAWGTESIAIDTYYRRLVPMDRLSSAFGFIDMITNLGWILAAVAGIWLIGIFPVHYLLLAIAPFSVLAFFVARRAPNDRLVTMPVMSAVTRSLRNMVGRCTTTWGKELYLTATLVFFTAILSTLSSFFLPIFVYEETGSAMQAILIAIAVTIPSLFAYHLGRFADILGPRRTFSLGLAVTILALSSLVHFQALPATLAAIFVLGLVLELFSLAQKCYVTQMSPESLYDERGTEMQAISVLGGIAGPLAVGIAFDWLGLGTTLLYLTGATGVLLLLVLLVIRTRTAPAAALG